MKRGISKKRVEEVMAKKGKLTCWEMLRCRVRYFCDGAVLGTKDFVNGIFEHERAIASARNARRARARCATARRMG